ncbi:MAG: hypothetical protein H6Q86_4386 [candidate division NC10 bacterium]|nr:hypothetical protein [candidate division NC10 bacterium]
MDNDQCSVGCRGLGIASVPRLELELMRVVVTPI